MSNYPEFVEDDENDTLAIERWEAHIIEKYPNPARKGCPDRATLERFVETPGQVSLQELHDRHITRCRECVQDLRALRAARDQRINEGASASQSWLTWRSSIAAVAACLILTIGLMFWKHQMIGKTEPKQAAETLKVEVDLSEDGVLRGTETTGSKGQVSLPRGVVEVHLILPYYSPAGAYRITVHKERSSAPLRSEQSSAVANGPRTELQVRLDLHALASGHYYLGTTHDGEPTYFYSLSLN